MRLFNIPNYDNIYLDTNCMIYQTKDDMLIKLNPIAEGLYKLMNETVNLSHLVCITKYGYLPYHNFNTFSFKSEDMYKTLVPDCQKIVKGVDFILINNMKFKICKEFPWLYANIFGAVYDLEHNRFKVQTQDKDGYRRFNINKNKTNYAVHRFVYLCWNSLMLKDIDNLTIHHKDSRKYNNYLNNLELISSELNTRYSILNKEKKLRRYFTETDIHIICQMLSENKTYRQIASIFGINDFSSLEFHSFRSLLLDLLKNDRRWKDISSQYDFSGYTGNIDPNRKFTNNDIIMMRKEYQQGISYVEIAKKYSTSPKYISDIIRNKKRKNIVEGSTTIES